MKFGPVPVQQAEGAILAHSVRLADAGGLDFSKGVRLGPDHVAALARAGRDTVVVARLEEGDLHEDEAAARIAQALAGPGDGLAQGAAATGRVNLRAARPGIVEIDAAAIEAVNRITPAITVATVAEWTRLAPRGLAVTVKIIPFAVAGADVEKACALGADAVRLRTPCLATASLIESRTGPDTPADKGRRAIKGRLEALEVALDDRVVVAHEIDDIAAALRAATGDLLLILTGSATSDARDTAPEALRAAGGEMIYYGMPVDPGNLLFIGRLGTRPVIGLPGCARSPALNGADWVIERVICGLAPESIDIAGMGVGGLLKEIPSRPRPRDGAARRAKG